MSPTASVVYISWGWRARRPEEEGTQGPCPQPGRQHQWRGCSPFPEDKSLTYHPACSEVPKLARSIVLSLLDPRMARFELKDQNADTVHPVQNRGYLRLGKGLAGFALFAAPSDESSEMKRIRIKRPASSRNSRSGMPKGHSPTSSANGISCSIEAMTRNFIAN